jgi:hypothetical protein
MDPWKIDKSWSLLPTAEGGNHVYIKIDEQSKIVRIVRSDGSRGEVRLNEFETFATALTEAPCPVCGTEGTTLDVGALPTLKIVCSDCGTEFEFKQGQLVPIGDLPPRQAN